MQIMCPTFSIVKVLFVAGSCYLCPMQKKMTLQQFLDFFPVVELPVNLSEDTVEIFSKNNKVLPPPALHDYIEQWESDLGEYDEIVPCLQLPGELEFIGIIYWKGGLLQYEYILVTLSKDGELIARRPIASTIVEDGIIKQSVASIDEDMIIHIMAGANPEGETTYDPSNSQAFNMEIMSTGDVLFSLGDD